MKKIPFLIFALFTAYAGYAQTRVLSKSEVNKIFPNNGGLKYRIRIVYNYTDQTGTHYLPFCEQFQNYNVEGDSTYSRVYAADMLMDSGMLKTQWEMNDATLQNENEYDIHFLARFSIMKDIDGDGIVEPVIITGTWGPYGPADSRVKILIYYKGRKVAIRHQNSRYDGQRITKIDEGFYTLPAKIQDTIKDLMRSIEKDERCVYAANWEVMMTKKKTLIQ